MVYFKNALLSCNMLFLYGPKKKPNTPSPNNNQPTNRNNKEDFAPTLCSGQL